MEPETAMASMADDTRRRKGWHDLSPKQRKGIVLAIAEVVMTTIAVADLVRRPAGQLRGTKPFWFATLAVQPFGPILYLIAGRRRPIR